MMDEGEILSQLRDEQEFVRHAMKAFEAARKHWADWRDDAEEDYAFVAGEQWDPEAKSQLERELRPAITFNRIGPVIDTISGLEITSRQEVRYIPREIGDVGVNELLTGAAEWFRDECDAEDEESDMFLDAVICGMGWTETRLDYESGPEGVPVIDRVDPLEMYPDPMAKKRNLDDMRHLFRVKELSPEEFDKLFPGKRDKVMMGAILDGMDSSSKIPGDEYQYPEHRPENAPKTYKVIEYQWCEHSPVAKVADPMSGEVETMEMGPFKKLAERMLALGMPMKAVRQKEKRIHRAFLANGVLLEKGPAPCKTHFNYRCVTGKRDRNKRTWYGIVRAMKDPQRWANKWLSQALHILNTQAAGGLMAEEGAFTNIRKAQKEWSRPDRIALLNDGAISGQKIMPKPQQGFPPQFNQLMEFAITSIRDVSGVNIELMGLADRGQAAALENARKQAGFTILASMFDGLRRYRKEQGRVLLYYITNYLSDGRLVRIAGDDYERYVPLVQQPDTVKYDVIVDQAPTSPNQKEKVWTTLMQLMPALTKLDIPSQVWAELAKYSPLPDAVSQKIGEAIKNRQPPPEQQAMQQIQMAQGQAELQKTQSEAMENQAQANKAAADAQVELAGAELDRAQFLFGGQAA